MSSINQLAIIVKWNQTKPCRDWNLKTGRFTRHYKHMSSYEFFKLWKNAIQPSFLLHKQLFNELINFKAKITNFHHYSHWICMKTLMFTVWCLSIHHWELLLIQLLIEAWRKEISSLTICHWWLEKIRWIRLKTNLVNVFSFSFSWQPKMFALIFESTS